jgi:hypothetical protein
MPIDFPSSPTTGQVYTYLGKSWVYNGTGWDSPRALSEIGAVQTFENAAARTAAIPTPTEGIVSYLNDVDLLQTNNGSAWVTTGNAGVNAYNFVQTLYYTSSGTFTKATYPWLRAIRVRVQGAGGGSGGARNMDAGVFGGSGGGGGGAYAESFITNIPSLDSSITITVGAGGAAGAAGLNSGASGGTSSFGTAVTANGGSGGGSTGGFSSAVFFANAGAGATSATGDLITPGGSGTNGYMVAAASNAVIAGAGGDSVLGFSPLVNRASFEKSAAPGLGFGSGARGASSEGGDAARAGAAGAPGIVIVELYA